MNTMFARATIVLLVGLALLMAGCGGGGSNVLGPPAVVCFDPAILNAPANNSTNVNTADVTFEWTPSECADEYRVEVYDNPALGGQPVYQSLVLLWTGDGTMTCCTKTSAFTFAPGATYWWTVDSWVNPTGQKEGCGMVPCPEWVYSTPFVFTTEGTAPEPWAIKP